MESLERKELLQNNTAVLVFNPATKKYGVNGLLDEPIVPGFYDFIVELGEYYRVTIGDQKGLFKGNKQIIPVAYTDIDLCPYSYSDNQLFIYNGKKVGVYDIVLGKEIVPPVYEKVNFPVTWKGIILCNGKDKGFHFYETGVTLEPKACDKFMVCADFIYIDGIIYNNQDEQSCCMNFSRFERLELKGKDYVKGMIGDKGHFYLLNTDGKMLSEELFNNEWPSVKSKCAILRRHKDGKKQFLLKNGLNPKCYDNISLRDYKFQYGEDYVDLQVMAIEQNGKIGLLYQEDGTVLIPPKYDQISQSNNVFRVINDKKLGIYSYKGKEIVPAKYISVDMNYGYWYVRGDKGRGIIDTYGKVKIPAKYAEIERVTHKIFLGKTKRNTKDAYFFDIGNIIKGLTSFDDLSQNSYFKIRKKTLWAFVNYQGRFLTRYEWKDIAFIGSFLTLFAGEKKDGWVLIDKDGEKLSRPKPSLNPHKALPF